MSSLMDWKRHTESLKFPQWQVHSRCSWKPCRLSNWCKRTGRVPRELWVEVRIPRPRQVKNLIRVKQPELDQVFCYWDRYSSLHLNPHLPFQGRTSSVHSELADLFCLTKKVSLSDCGFQICKWNRCEEGASSHWLIERDQWVGRRWIPRATHSCPDSPPTPPPVCLLMLWETLKSR